MFRKNIHCFPWLLLDLAGTALNKPMQLNHQGSFDACSRVWPSEAVFSSCSFPLPCSSTPGVKVCHVVIRYPQKPLWVGRGGHSPTICSREWKGTDKTQKGSEGRKNGSRRKSKVALVIENVLQPSSTALGEAWCMQSTWGPSLVQWCHPWPKNHGPLKEDDLPYL